MADVARPDRIDEVSIEHRRHQVAQLYLAHQSQRAIARQLGVDPMTICRDIQELRREWREENRFNVAEIMERDLVELDEMEALAVRQWAETHDGHWFDRRLKVKERRARMLGFEVTQERPPEENLGDGMDLARREFAQVLLAVADEGAARRRIEQALAQSSVVIEGGLGDDRGEAGAASPTGGLDGLADQERPGLGEDADGSAVGAGESQERPIPADRIDR